MYFILSKVLLLLIFPFTWIFVLLVYAVITKNTRRKYRLLIATAVLLYLFSCPLLLNWLAGAWDYPASNNQKHYSCAIILGGFSSVDNNGNGYFNSSADRFIQGMKLLTDGKAGHLLISGGNGNLIPGKFREADWVKTQLQELKYPDSSILIEDRSRNTIENAQFSKPILQKAKLQPPYLLVTSAFHMRRAYMIFKKQGYNVDADPCNFTNGGGFSIDALIPDAGVLAGWNTYLKEVVGYVVDSFKKP
jgi:uncharacterized SAM-binding protein YcdF (DUF218 family)